MLNTSDEKILERWQSRTESLELKMHWFDYESGFFFKKGKYSGVIHQSLNYTHLPPLRPLFQLI